ncbi:MAG: SsrA-binding protein [Candidatus Westeberhardia cardiocondylae]|nr:SsrA-binding protein [Candidatus Westeberhardia cardiocondylae]
MVDNKNYCVVSVNNNNYVRKNFILEKEIESGIMLLGYEVKYLRCFKVDIRNSYVSFRDKEAYLLNLSFPSLNKGVSVFYSSINRNKLLLKKYELDYLIGYLSRKNYIILVLSMYWKRSWIKVKLGIGKKKRVYDKRFVEKDRIWKFDRSLLMKKFNK